MGRKGGVTRYCRRPWRRTRSGRRGHRVRKWWPIDRNLFRCYSWLTWFAADATQSLPLLRFLLWLFLRCFSSLCFFTASALRTINIKGNCCPLPWLLAQELTEVVDWKVSKLHNWLFFLPILWVGPLYYGQFSCGSANPWILGSGRSWSRFTIETSQERNYLRSEIKRKDVLMINDLNCIRWLEN